MDIKFAAPKIRYIVIDTSNRFTRKKVKNHDVRWAKCEVFSALNRFIYGT